MPSNPRYALVNIQGQTLKMEAVKNLGRTLTGRRQGETLLGDSLPELLRRATAKELLIPDVALNQQVGRICCCCSRILRVTQGCFGMGDIGPVTEPFGPSRPGVDVLMYQA